MNFELTTVFQGLDVLINSEPKMVISRIVLILLGFLLVYLGKKGILEALIMIPMGLGMSTINASVMFFDPLGMAGMLPKEEGKIGTLFLDSTVAKNEHLMTLMQIDWLQPIYTLTFSNALIACLVFLGIGTLLDVGFVMARPYSSMTLAVFAEFGTIITVPIAILFGLRIKEAASIAMVGSADGPMVIFTSLKLAHHLFVPITVVAYMYLGLAYGVFPMMAKLSIPKRLRGLEMPKTGPKKEITSGQKLLFAVVGCTILCFLFPVASPLLFCLFLGIAIRESGLESLNRLISDTVLYTATLTLGILLGVLCQVDVILDSQVLPILILGMLSLFLSGVGGIIGGYFMYFITGGKYNPVIGIAAVSCVPTTAKVAQYCVTEANPKAIILDRALGANICGVITSAIIAAIYISTLGEGL